MGGKRIPKAAVRHELDGVTYYVRLRWGEWNDLRGQLQESDERLQRELDAMRAGGLEAEAFARRERELRRAQGQENQELVVAVLRRNLVAVEGLEDDDGNPAEFDGDLSAMPSHHVMKLMAAVSSAQLPAEMMPEVPTPGPSGIGLGAGRSPTRPRSSSSISS